jgi:hypothetical protein
MLDDCRVAAVCMLISTASHAALLTAAGLRLGEW